MNQYTKLYLFWFVLGLVLLIFELIGAEFLLWSGLSAILTGFISNFFSILFLGQFLIFGFLNFFLLIIWGKFLKPKIKLENNFYINQKKYQLIGYRTVLSQDLVNKSGRLFIGDSSWPVKSEYEISKGTLVEVCDIEGIILIIKPSDI